ncbi:hypothetical protein [Portibacter lacus]|uniref:Uncharacterized protein n=1 Tax=Portibacter lacus TaxID=1099794 RepID=A0AA37WF37_9BACT|nr:hypothetical protein [Portibacter lacus]GLR16560.1 hypothetical protein GCM10007940_11750 [Portibacter lacus]
MKKFLKIIGIIILVLVVLGVGSCFMLSEKMPEGVEGPEAEALTDKMFEAIDKEAWDTTRIVTWDFMGLHQFLWNKETTDLKVNWGDTEVVMNLDAYDGTVTKGSETLEGDDKRKVIDKAFSFFCNDMFWLNAPVKARDEGTTRSIVTQEDGSKALLVQYSSGGVTPGDAYLWMLDDSGMPTGWKMWTQILPVKGIYTSWEGWKTLPTGAQISSLHDMKIYKMNISDIKSGQSYAELGIENPFK